MSTQSARGVGAALMLRDVCSVRAGPGRTTRGVVAQRRVKVAGIVERLIRSQKDEGVQARHSGSAVSNRREVQRTVGLALTRAGVTTALAVRQRIARHAHLGGATRRCGSSGEWRAARSQAYRGNRTGLASYAAPKKALSTCWHTSSDEVQQSAVVPSSGDTHGWDTPSMLALENSAEALLQVETSPGGSATLRLSPYCLLACGAEAKRAGERRHRPQLPVRVGPAAAEHVARKHKAGDNHVVCVDHEGAPYKIHAPQRADEGDGTSGLAIEGEGELDTERGSQVARGDLLRLPRGKGVAIDFEQLPLGRKRLEAHRHIERVARKVHPDGALEVDCAAELEVEDGLRHHLKRRWGHRDANLYGLRAHRRRGECGHHVYL
eukprot:scaffold68365_cov63-Phaeocystis_antarctica.AAC.3